MFLNENRAFRVSLFTLKQLPVFFYTLSLIKMWPKEDEELEFVASSYRICLIASFDLMHVYLDLPSSPVPLTLKPLSSFLRSVRYPRSRAQCGDIDPRLSCPDGTFANPVSLTKGVFFKQAAPGTGCTLRVKDHTWINLVYLWHWWCLDRDIEGNYFHSVLLYISKVMWSDGIFTRWVKQIFSYTKHHFSCFFVAKHNMNLLCTQPAFLAYCFQTHKDLSAPKSTPKILFTPPSAGPPSVLLLIAEKAGGLLVKPGASRLSCGPPETLHGGISLSGVQPQEIHFMFVHTPEGNLLPAISSLPNPTGTKEKEDSLLLQKENAVKTPRRWS